MNFTGVTTTSISATASGNVDLSIPVMADWENDAEATNPVQTTTSFSGLAVNNLTMSAPTSNTAKLTKTGINGNVDVVEYLASMGFDFATLINVDGDDFAFANGEWTVTWNDYGTVRGTTMCSSTGNKGEIAWGGTINGTPNVSGTEADNKSCWCKMTAWTPNSGDATPAASLWVFLDTAGPAGDCAAVCAVACADTFTSDSGFRSAIFGSVQ